MVRLLAHTLALGEISEGSEKHSLHWAKKGWDGQVGTGTLAPQWHLFGFISGFASPRKQPVLHGQRDRALGCAWPRLDVLGPVNGLSVLHLL